MQVLRGRKQQASATCLPALAHLSSTSSIAQQLLLGCRLLQLTERRVQVSRGFRQEVSATCPPALADLIKRAWSQNPAKRPYMGSIAHELAGIIADIEAAQARSRAAQLPAAQMPAS